MIYILISTYNGQVYLDKQLKSLYNQTYKDFKIIARDDMSSDKTLDILKSYDLEILSSKENLGAKKSFGTLLEYALNSSSDYFMFCDQDDIWEEDKIELTLKKMREMEKKFPDTPILIHTDLKVVDEDLSIINNSFWNYENINPSKNTLNRLLLQNTITGCTTMINRKLAKISIPIPSQVIMHDWWLGLIVSSFGKIAFVEQSTIQYRQHNSNDTGAKEYGFGYIINKVKKFNNINIDKNKLQAKIFLDNYRNSLNDKDIDIVENFIDIDKKTFFKYQFFKQGFARNLGVFLKI